VVVGAGVPEVRGLDDLVGLGTAVAAALAGGVIWLLPTQDFRLSIWLLSSFFAASAVVGGRLSFRVLDHTHQQGRPGDRRVLIFGAGRGGDLAVRAILATPQLGLRPVGFVDDDPEKWGHSFHGLTVYPGEHLGRLLGEFQVDDVIVSTRKLPLDRYDAVKLACARAGSRPLSFDLRLLAASDDRPGAWAEVSKATAAAM
jgi:UDP-GlcNAc:undecaprenyl-phosphate GlcNAc-1-phosphate transferase